MCWIWYSKGAELVRNLCLLLALQGVAALCMAFLLAAVHSCPSYRHLGGAAAEVPAAVVGHMNAVVRSAYAVAGESGKGGFPLHKGETFFLD